MTHPITRREVRRRFPIGAEISFKGEIIGNVVGYSQANGDGDWEVVYQNYKIDHSRWPENKFHQFSVRSRSFRRETYGTDKR